MGGRRILPSLLVCLLSFAAHPAPALANSGSASQPAETPTARSADTWQQAFPQGLPMGARVDAQGDVHFADGAILRFGVQGAQVCPGYWLCLYENWHFNQDNSGRMLEFQECCYWQNLSTYNFSNMMSSWKNFGLTDAKWAYDANGGGTKRCMNQGATNQWVGTGDNDKASSIYIWGASGGCT